MCVLYIPWVGGGAGREIETYAHKPKAKKTKDHKQVLSLASMGATGAPLKSADRDISEL